MFPSNHTWSHAVAPLNPPLALGRTFWQVFLERVDSLIKVVHRPSASQILHKVIHNPSLLTEGQEALLLVIYLACVSAMDATDVQAELQMSKATAISTYRMAAKQSLIRAGLVTTSEWTTMQALVLFIALSRLQGKHESAWTLAGLAERLDSSLGEDRSHFGGEMRRRLRWHLWYLDRRLRDDRGQNSGSSTHTKTPPLKLGSPLNCQDSELSTCMAAPPTAQPGWTEMSFSLLTYDFATTEQIVESDAPWMDKTKAVKDCQHRLHSKYLSYCNGTEAIHWLARHVSYVMITEMWMKLCSPRLPSQDLSGSREHTIRDQLFDAVIDILDTQKRLENELPAANGSGLLAGIFSTCR